MEEGSEWDGAGSRVRLKFWKFRTKMGAEVFVVKREGCGVCQGGMGVGLGWWLLRESAGGVWEAGEGCGARVGFWWLCEGSGLEFWVFSGLLRALLTHSILFQSLASNPSPVSVVWGCI